MRILTPLLDEYRFSACEHFVAPTASACCRSWMFFSMKSFFQQILSRSKSHRTCPACCLQCRCPSCSHRCRSVSLLKRLLCFECCLELLRLGLRLDLPAGTAGVGPAAMRNCRIDLCGESCNDDVHVLCVDFSCWTSASNLGYCGTGCSFPL